MIPDFCRLLAEGDAGWVMKVGSMIYLALDTNLLSYIEH